MKLVNQHSDTVNAIHKEGNDASSYSKIEIIQLLNKYLESEKPKV
jgi:hypothetical protein